MKLRILPFDVTIRKYLCALVRQQGILESSKGASICRNISTIEISSESSCVLRLRIDVGEIGVVNCQAGVIVGLLAKDDRCVLILARTCKNSIRSLNGDLILSVVTRRVGSANQSHLAIASD